MIASTTFFLFHFILTFLSLQFSCSCNWNVCKYRSGIMSTIYHYFHWMVAHTLLCNYNLKKKKKGTHRQSAGSTLVYVTITKLTKFKTSALWNKLHLRHLKLIRKRGLEKLIIYKYCIRVSNFKVSLANIYIYILIFFRMKWRVNIYSRCCLRRFHLSFHSK